MDVWLSLFKKELCQNIFFLSLYDVCMNLLDECKSAIATKQNNQKLTS